MARCTYVLEILSFNQRANLAVSVGAGLVEIVVLAVEPGPALPGQWFGR